MQRIQNHGPDQDDTSVDPVLYPDLEPGLTGSIDMSPPKRGLGPGEISQQLSPRIPKMDGNATTRMADVLQDMEADHALETALETIERDVMGYEHTVAMANALPSEGAQAAIQRANALPSEGAQAAIQRAESDAGSEGGGHPVGAS